MYGTQITAVLFSSLFIIICGVDKAVIRGLIERVVPKLFSLNTIILGDAMSQLKLNVLGILLLYQNSFT